MFSLTRRRWRSWKTTCYTDWPAPRYRKHCLFLVLLARQYISIISTCIPLIFFILNKINEISFSLYLCDLFGENPKDIQISELKLRKILITLLHRDLWWTMKIWSMYWTPPKPPHKMSARNCRWRPRPRPRSRWQERSSVPFQRAVASCTSWSWRWASSTACTRPPSNSSSTCLTCQWPGN